MNMNTLKKQKGFVLVVLALLLVVLIGFLALAVDIGVLYSARTSAQEVADAAALAGAFTFINDTQSPQPSGWKLLPRRRSMRRDQLAPSHGLFRTRPLVPAMLVLPAAQMRC